MRRNIAYEALRCTRVHTWLITCVLSVGPFTAVSLNAQSLTWLGTLGGNSSVAYDVSVKGQVVGVAKDRLGFDIAFVWENEVMRSLPVPSGMPASYAYGISADGRVIVGEYWTPPRDDGSQDVVAVRWVNQQRQALPPLYPDFPRRGARGVSAKGDVVVGLSAVPRAGALAVRWQDGQIQSVAGSHVDAGSDARGVSADGSVVVGREDFYPFRWTQDTGTELLGGFSVNGAANSASGNGSVIVGYVTDSSRIAARWVITGPIDPRNPPTPQLLGTLGGNSSEALDVSEDGQVVVGTSKNSAGQDRAFRWRAGRGMEDLNQTYARLLTSGSYLTRANAISLDGRYIVGQGYNATTGRFEAFLLDTRCPQRADVNNDGIVDDADLLVVLFNFGNRAVVPIFTTNSSNPPYFYPLAVDNNGTVFGYFANSSNRVFSAFWRLGTGIQLMQGFANLQSIAYACDATGTRVVGYREVSQGGGFGAFLWRNNTVQSVANPPSRGLAVSGDIVVGGLGTSDIFTGWQGTAFVWRNNSLANLGGVLTTNRYAYATGFGRSPSNPNVIVITGSAQNSAGAWRPFRLHFDTTSFTVQNVEDLGTLGGNAGYATGISADGTTVVGYAQTASGETRAFRWSNGTKIPAPTPNIGLNSSFATAVSEDGRIVVGWGRNADGLARIFRWDAFRGIEDLSAKYSLPGDDHYVLHPLVQPFQNGGMSANGRYIICATFGNNFFGAYRIDTQLQGDVNGDGIVDDADLLEVLFNFGNSCRN